MSASVVSPEIFDDEWFGLLSDREMLVWIGAFSRLRDDQGRFVENAALARARLFPYRDVPVDDVQCAFNRFVSDERLHRYEAAGQTLLQIVHWWEHQHPQWAAASKLPSPEGWTDRIRTRFKGKFHVVNWDSPGGFGREVRPNGSAEECQSSPEGLTRRSRAKGSEPEPEPEPIDQERCRTQGTSDGANDDDFAEWWTAYGKIGSKADAERLYRFWRGKGAERADLLAAANAYRADCTRNDSKMQHARTFLAKPPKGSRARWYEWAEGEEHGSMDPSKDNDLAAVLRAGGLTYGGDNGRGSAVRKPDESAGPLGRGQDDRLGVPPQCLDEGD